MQLQDALRAKGAPGAYGKTNRGQHQNGDHGREGIDHTADAKKRHQEHRQHEHGAAQPSGHTKQLGQHGAHTGGHTHHHKEEEQRPNDTGGGTEPLNVPRYQQLVHFGAFRHLRQPDEQNADDRKQQRRQDKAHIAPVAEGAKELPQLLAGNKPRAQKTADVGKRQRKGLDLLHTTPHVEFALPI